MNLLTRQEFCKAAGLHTSTSAKYIESQYGVKPVNDGWPHPIFSSKDVPVVKELFGKHKKPAAQESPSTQMTVECKFTEEDRATLHMIYDMVTVLSNALMGPPTK